MKKITLLLSALLVLSVAVLAVRMKSVEQPGAEQLMVLQKSFAAGCAPPRPEWNAAVEMPALEGWGNIRFPVSTRSDSAQYFFNQGMGMFYGFHIIEAMGSFKQAQKFDPNCAMLYWGEALAHGPNINDMGYAENPAALLALEKARQYASAATPLEKALIHAQSVRFDADTTIVRKVLNERYVAAMKEVYQQFTANAEAAVLYADALMQLHPWDWYTRDRKPKEWTPQLVSLLEGILRKFPNHPGANHYYIHATEGSATPSKALASARRLVNSTPGLAHMVHMPSHIFNQTGNYKEGAEQNVKAIAAYENYRSRYAPVGEAFILYEVHNRFMEFANRLMMPNEAASLQSALAASTSFDTMFNNLPAPIGPFAHHIYAAPLISHVRYSAWDKILQYPEQPTKWIYVHFLQQFAKGMAYAHKGNYAAAEQSLQWMQANIDHADMLVPGAYFNEAAAGGKVALHILEGTIAGQQQQWDKAIDGLQKAVKAEEQMMYNEPKDWLLPARYYLATYLLRAKRFAVAEREFKKDLAANPANTWSLQGLETALLAQRKTKEAAATRKLHQQKFGKGAK